MIVNHNVKKNQFVGLQRAYFDVAGTGDATIEFPLTGPKQIRKIAVVTADNSAAVGPLTLAVKQGAASLTDIVGGLDIKQLANTYVVADEAALDKNLVKMSASFNGIAFAVNNAAGADSWSFRVEVVYSARTNVNDNVYVDEKIEGIL